MDPIARLFAYWHVDPANREVGPIAAALINAALTVEQVLTPDRFDEETITSALLGSLAGGLPWVAPLVGTRSAEQTDIAWGHFGKKRTDQQGAMAEPDYGADFALALRLGEDEVRVALFQAKRPEGGRGKSIPIFKAVDDRTARFAQFLTLRATAYRLLRNVGRPTGVKSLHWIHYLGYLSTGPACIPMSELDEFHEAAGASDMSASPTLPVPSTATDLMSVLYAAVAQPPGDCSGWLSMTVAQARAQLTHLKPLMPVYTADERSGGREAILDDAEVVAVAPPKPAPDSAPNAPSPSTPHL